MEQSPLSLTPLGLLIFYLLNSSRRIWEGQATSLSKASTNIQVYSWHLILGSLLKFLDTHQFWLESDNNNGYITWRPTWASMSEGHGGESPSRGIRHGDIIQLHRHQTPRRYKSHWFNTAMRHGCHLQKPKFKQQLTRRVTPCVPFLTWQIVAVTRGQVGGVEYPLVPPHVVQRHGHPSRLSSFCCFLFIPHIDPDDGDTASLRNSDP
jgi:hypothetical protein